MSKINVIAAFFACVALYACQKELVPARYESGRPFRVSAVIEGDGKVDIEQDGNTLKVSWSPDDRIIVFDGNGSSRSFTVEDISGKVATFKQDLESGAELLLPEGTTLYAVYCPQASPYELEDGVLTVDVSRQNGQIDSLSLMIAQATVRDSQLDLKFQNVMSILGIRNPSFDGIDDDRLDAVTVAGPEIYTRAEIKVVDGVLTLVPTEKGSLKVALPEPLPVVGDKTPEGTEIFAVVIPFRQASDLAFTASLTGKTVLLRHTKSQKLFCASKYYYTTPQFYREDGFGCQFSVSATKKVYFSAGNLICDNSVTPAQWSFEDEQFFVPYFNEITGVETVYDSKHIRHFYWSDKDYGCGEYYDGTSYPSAEDRTDWGAVFEQRRGWSILSKAEWAYLLYGRGSGDTFCKSEVNIADISGHFLVIAPDGNTQAIKEKYNIIEWRAAEKLGFVCLAPAGYRTESNYPDTSCMQYIGLNGFYWTSDACKNLGDKSRARSLIFGCTPYGLSTNGQFFRNQGFSVRLVCE